MPRPVLHLIPNAHLDPVWLWPWRDGAAETLTTVQSAVDRLGEVADLRFVRSSANAWRWIAEQDPRLFAAARTLVEQGRIEVVGGWIEQPDCNLPSTEALLRQGLYGQGWFRRHRRLQSRLLRPQRRPAATAPPRRPHPLCVHASDG